MEWTPTANEYAVSFGNHILEEAYTNQEYLQRLKPYLTTPSSDESAPKPVKDKARNTDAVLTEMIAAQTKFILAMERHRAIRRISHPGKTPSRKAHQ